MVIIVVVVLVVFAACFLERDFPLQQTKTRGTKGIISSFFCVFILLFQQKESEKKKKEKRKFSDPISGSSNTLRGLERPLLWEK